MTRNRTTMAVLGILISAALAGCSRELPRWMKREPPAQPAETASAVPATSSVPDDLGAIAQRLMQHHRHTYLGATGDYRFYVGGVFDARYNPDSGILVLASDTGAPLLCKYSPRDELYIPEASAAAVHQSDCARLRSELRAALAH